MVARSAAQSDPAEPPLPTGSGLVVRVVDGESRKPAVGAALFLIEQADLLRYGGARLDLDWQQLVPQFGREFRADAHGEATLPYARTSPPPHLFVRYGLDTRWAHRLLEPALASPLVVELKKSRALVAEVVDGNGRPVAGETVVLHGNGVGFVDDDCIAVTDEAGRALFGAIDARIERAGGGEPLGIALFNESSAMPDEVTPVSGGQFAGAPLRIVDDEVSWIDFTVCDSEGKRLDLDGIATIEAIRRYLIQFPDGSSYYSTMGAETVPPNFCGSSTIPVRAARIAHGRARVAVPPSVEVKFDAWCGVRHGEGKLAKTAEAGATTTAAIILDDPIAPQPLRAVDDHGRSVGSRRLEVAIDIRTISALQRFALPPVETAADGTFRLESIAEIARLGRVVTLYARDEGGVIELEGQAILPGSEEVASEDSEDTDGAEAGAASIEVVMTPPPLLVGGVVVDDAGAPIAHAVIRVSCMPTVDQGNFGNTPLVSFPELATTTDAAGHFRVVGHAADGEFTLAASECRHGDVPSMRFEPGTPNLLIKLPRRGALAGRVLLPDDVPSSVPDVSLLLLSSDERYRWIDLATDGRFFVADLPPGRATLAITLDEFAGDLHYRSWEPKIALTRLPEIVIEPEQVCRDPRLAAIDLREAIHAHHVEIVDAAGAPIAAGRLVERLSPRDRDSGRTPWTVAFEGGAHDFYVARPLPEFDACAEGFRLARFDPSGKRTRVVLQPGLPVLVKLDPDTPLPDDTWRLSVALWREDEVGEVDLDARHRPLDAEQPAHLVIATEGCHNLGVRLEHRPSIDSDEWFPITDDVVHDVTLTDTPDEQKLLASVDDELRAVIRATLQEEVEAAKEDEEAKDEQDDEQ